MDGDNNSVAFPIGELQYYIRAPLRRLQQRDEFGAADSNHHRWEKEAGKNYACMHTYIHTYSNVTVCPFVVQESCLHKTYIHTYIHAYY